MKEIGDEDGFASLQVDGDDSASVWTAFDLSYLALDPSARRVFRLLGVIASGNLSVHAIAAMNGATAAHVNRALSRAGRRPSGRAALWGQVRPARPAAALRHGQEQGRGHRTGPASGVAAAAPLVSAWRRPGDQAVQPVRAAAGAAGRLPGPEPGIRRDRRGAGVAGKRTGAHGGGSGPGGRSGGGRDLRTGRSARPAAALVPVQARSPRQ